MLSIRLATKSIEKLGPPSTSSPCRAILQPTTSYACDLMMSIRAACLPQSKSMSREVSDVFFRYVQR
jgi:hypothetical protein